MAIIKPSEIKFFGVGPKQVKKTVRLAQALNNPEFPSQFRSVFGEDWEDGLGDCHTVSTALMRDMLTLRMRGCHHVSGIIDMQRNERGLHSWCEHNGVVYDGACGVLIVASATKYYHDRNVEIISRSDRSAFLRWESG